MADEPEIFCVGAAHWDTLARAAGPVGDGADVPGHIRRRPGGVALNVAMALAREGRRPALIGAVGRDSGGNALVREAASAGVETMWLHRPDSETDSYVAIEGPDGELVAAVADCSALDRAGTDILLPLRTGGPAVARVVFDGNLAPEVMAATRATSSLRRAEVVVIAASPAKAPQLAGGLKALGATLFANRAEAEALAGRAFASAAEAAGALLTLVPCAVVTDGPRPAVLAAPDVLISVTPKAAPAAGTGAGDAFVAGFLAADLAGETAKGCLFAGAAAAARHLEAPA